MVYQWEPGTQYGLGTIIEYRGQRYKIIQAHTSQGDWTPPATPALWGRLPETAGGGGYQPDYPPQLQPQPQGGGYQGGDTGDQKPWHEQHTQKVEVHHEEQNKHWYDLDDHRKKQLEVGGGLAAGLALLGAGYYAYHEHQKSEEEKKAQVWGLQKWVRDAQARAEEFHRNGPQAPVTWVLTHGKNIPRGALPGGQENGQPFFIARAFYEGGIQVGKAGPQFEQGAVIGYKHKTHEVGTYEVLVSESYAVKWVDVRGSLKAEELSCTLVEGGHESNGTPLFVAQAHHRGGVHPGKASSDLNGAFICYDSKEECVEEYCVLAYA